MTGVEAALLNRPKDAREHRVRFSAAFGSVAPADCSRDDRGAQGLLCAPVGGVDRVGFEKEGKDGGEFDREMRSEAARDACLTGPTDEGVELVLQMAARNGHAVDGDAPLVISIADAKRVLENALDARRETVFPMVADQHATPPQEMALMPTSAYAHLLRRCRELATDYPRAAWPERVHAVLQRALAVRDWRNGATSRHRARRSPAAGSSTNSPTSAITRFAHRRCNASRRISAVELPAVFGFLFDPAVDATNWRAEQALRPAVAMRKVCAGNRSARGLQTQYILASLLRTAVQRQVANRMTIARLLRSARPIVPHGFHVPPSRDAPQRSP